MSGITTHVLDTGKGRPAKGMSLKLQYFSHHEEFIDLNTKVTNDDGRVPDLLTTPLKTGVYRLIFETGEYYKSQGEKCFYPEATIVFNIEDETQHYHVPLLISGFGYSTYRGS